MTCGDHYTSQGDHYSLDDDGIEHLVIDVRNPLSVAYASAQLLQRQVERGEVRDVHDLSDRLAAIERSCKHIDARLQQIERDRG